MILIKQRAVVLNAFFFFKATPITNLETFHTHVLDLTREGRVTSALSEQPRPACWPPPPSPIVLCIVNK